KLERILYVLPAAARKGGADIQELARTLEVEPEIVLAELEEATQRVYHHRGGVVEPFEITIDGERVTVRVSEEFKRPVRLSQREALALHLGLRTLAAEASAERRPAILDLARRLA